MASSDCNRGALSVLLNQIFNIFSAFHFLDLHFTLVCLASCNINFRIFQFPVFSNFSVFASTIQMVIKSFLDILTRADIIFINCF